MKFPKDPGVVFISKESEGPPPSDIVDGRNPAPGEYVDYLIIYRVSYIPGGAGFLPSTVTFESCRNSIRNIWMAKAGAKAGANVSSNFRSIMEIQRGPIPPRKLPALFYFTLQLSLFRKHWIPNKKFSFPIILLMEKKSPAPVEVGNRLVMYNLSHYLLRSQVVSWI